VRTLSFVLVLVAVLPATAGTLELNGQFVQGGLIRGQTKPGAQVRFDGREIRVSPNGVFLIGFSRDAASLATLIVLCDDGSKEVRTLTIARRIYDIQRIDGLAPALVTPPQDVLTRIQRENGRISRARHRDTAEQLFESGWIWPAQGQISGVYGSQRILNGEPRQPHYGLDISAPAGSPVVAPADGIVTLAAREMYFSGGTLILDHGHGLTSAFLHLSRILVREGELVHRGEIIAEIGATGRATAAHLDWRINLFNARLDPALLVGPTGQ